MPTTPGDVHRVRLTLLHFVPLEIADIILHAAEYWCTFTASRKELLYACASANNDNADICYITTNPIPHTIRDGKTVPTKVTKVKFNLLSCDQGWGGDIACKGTYKHSCTWFQAAIIRPQTKAIEVWHKSLVDAKNLDTKELSKHHLTSVQNPVDMSDRWEIQRNIQLSRHKKAHEIVWTDKVDPDAKKDADTKGCGSGEQFVASLSGGDSIAVIARAKYPGWVNNVFRAEVEVSYQV